MPVLIASLVGALLNVVGSLVGRALVALGIGVVTYTGVSVVLDGMRDQAVASLLGLDPQLLGLLGVLRVGTFISILSSAVMARLLLTGLQSGTVRRWVTK